jgi:hypothetical protein
MTLLRQLLAASLLASVPAACATAQAPTPADSLAVSFHQRCGALRSDRLMTCYNQALMGVLQQDGVAPTMAVLQRVAELDLEVRREGHMYAHSIGLSALRDPATVGTTFAACAPTFQSGCYHGVIQAYFMDRLKASGDTAVSAQMANGLCASYRGPSGDRWLLFQCVHGMGHGLAMVYSHDLPKMLAGCDLLSDAWEQEGCYGGSFMENVVNFTTPHQMVGRPGEPMGDEHAGMDMGGGDMPGMDHEHMDHGEGAAAAPYKALDPKDPLYPCNTLADKYQHACWGMQTSAILFFNGNNIPATTKVCDSAPAIHRYTCYQSLGRDLSALTQQDDQRVMRLCSNGDPVYQPWCHVGYVKNLVDLDADGSKGVAYCRALSDLAAKRTCYAAVGEEMAPLAVEPAKKRAWCEAGDLFYRPLCLANAGLKDAQPGDGR